MWWKKSQTSTCQLFSNLRVLSRASLSALFLGIEPLVATCCYLLVHIFPLFYFLQTLHIYHSHASHIVSASDSSGGSPGFNHGECSSCVLTSLRFFQLAEIHVCRDEMSLVNRVWQRSGQLRYCLAFFPVEFVFLVLGMI